VAAFRWAGGISKLHPKFQAAGPGSIITPADFIHPNTYEGSP